MAEGVLQFNVASMVEDVLQQHGKRLGETDFASRRAQETSLRRYEVAGWLRKMVGVVLGKDLPAEPSEEDFRIGLRSGIILCTVLNKVQPGSVPKVVEAPVDTVIIPDGAALTAFQYFENVRNFLVAIEEMGIPTFEVSDLEQGGKSSRIVNCIMALKSYHDWKQSGGNGVWKFSGNPRPCTAAPKPHHARRSSDLFLNFLSRTSSSAGDKSPDSCITDDLHEMCASPSLQRLVRDLLSDKSPEEIPIIVESIINKVKEEFERKLERQTKLIERILKGSFMAQQISTSQDKGAYTTEIGTASQDESDSNSCMSLEIEATPNIRKANEKDLSILPLKHQEFIHLQNRTVEELKNLLNSTKQGMHVMQLKYEEDVDTLGKQVVRLASQASGYQKVLEENRKLYNQVQDLKGNIRVYCRVRPFLPGQANGLNVLDEIVDNSLTIQTSAKHGKGKKTFTFNKAFGPNSTQDEVFADTQPLIRSVLDGYNVCIFAYGQTGSGKTYTMTGPKELTKESLGVNYRALSDLFEISEQRKDTIAYNISVQMMEIYNEQVRDLLVTDGGNKRLEIRNNSSNGINVPNANLVNVTSTSDVIDLMNLGHKNRAVGSTSMNDRSSRSHSCLTVHVLGKDLTSGATLRGCMHLVDLAGSERCDKTDAVGDRLKEAQHINRSLSALGDVIAALAQKNAHVPYRNSKLTQLLQDSLGGQAKTLMFVHISPEPDALGETLSTLKFAERVSTVELGAAKTNREAAFGPDVKELKEQIASLKAALARKEGGGLHHSSLESPTSSASSPSHSCKTEDQSNCSSRRQSLDSQDSWPTIQEAVKVVSSSSLSGRSSRRQSPEVFFDNKRSPKISKAPSNVRRHSLDKNDDSDETSESSEQDYQCLNNIQKSATAASKLKRPTAAAKPAVKSQDTRSQIPVNKGARPIAATASSLVRRKTGSGK
ncbi:kinesin-like protein KIN-14I [Salvia miltiorrhiza]|uniref:kinesin-like protein KIN-14I n=1 Tax=Salvia miltiorrhiza TaxID=226208 RepID=UPI0025ACEAC4|nr:kinesin-like protein KIN-14I [Salvia miltiorrhiza]